MDVTITFTGVCAIAPGSPDHAASDGRYRLPGPLRVAMPSSSRCQNEASKKIPNNPNPTYIPVHIPFVLAEMDAEAAKKSKARRSRPADDTITAVGHAGGVSVQGGKSKKQKIKVDDSKTTSVWLPIRERLIVSIDGSSAADELVFDQSSDTGVAAVSDMRRVWKDRAKFRRECDPLWPLSRGVDSAVLTQVLVPFGQVAAHFRNAGVSGMFHPAKPKSDTPVTYPRLAPEVTITFTANESVEIASSSLVDGAPIDSIYFDADIGQELKLTIGNSDLDDLRRRISGEIVLPSDGEDADFELYYRLLKDPDNFCADDTDLPIPRESSNLLGLIRDCYVAFVE